MKKEVFLFIMISIKALKLRDVRYAVYLFVVVGDCKADVIFVREVGMEDY